MATDSSHGQVSLAGDGNDIARSTARNRRRYREMTKVMKDISEAAGGKFTTSLLVPLADAEDP